MFSSSVRERLIDSLEGSPDLLAYLIEHIAAGDPLWDFKSDPYRYCIREIVAHLADWDTIWIDRLSETITGKEPNLVPITIAKRAADQGYVSADPFASLAKYVQGRGETVALLRRLSGAEWKRVAFHPEEGRQSVETQAAWMLAHDDYHIKQVVKYLRERKAEG